MTRALLAILFCFVSISPSAAQQTGFAIYQVRPGWDTSTPIPEQLRQVGLTVYAVGHDANGGFALALLYRHKGTVEEIERTWLRQPEASGLGNVHRHVLSSCGKKLVVITFEQMITGHPSFSILKIQPASPTEAYMTLESARIANIPSAFIWSCRT